MPLWTPKKEWAGQDAFLIGGGSSLSNFDFTVLKHRNVIGCNSAFRLGPEIVHTAFFGDAGFFHKNKWDLEQFAGRVVTCSRALLDLNLPWCKQMLRIRDGVHSGNTLGWNYSTGAAAINLAVSLGAVRIFLLGYDLGRLDGKTHWHRFQREVADDSYTRFLRGFATLHNALQKQEGVEVLNVTDGSSKLPYFRRITPAVFLAYLNGKDLP